jgi:hypothetical protein
MVHAIQVYTSWIVTTLMRFLMHDACLSTQHHMICVLTRLTELVWLMPCDGGAV